MNNFQNTVFGLSLEMFNLGQKRESEGCILIQVLLLRSIWTASLIKYLIYSKYKVTRSKWSCHIIQTRLVSTQSKIKPEADGNDRQVVGEKL